MTTKYAVPDQVFVRVTAKTIAKTEISDSTLMQRQRIDLRLNIMFSNTQIQAAIQLGLGIVDSNQDHTRIVSCWAQCELYQIYLGIFYLTDNVIADMVLVENTLGAFSSVNAEPYERFLITWGTHYVDSVTVGGYVQTTTNVAFSNSTHLLTLAAALTGKFSSGTGSNGTKIAGTISLAYQDASSEIDTTTTTNAVVLGGDAKFTDFVIKSADPNAAAELYESWKLTLMTNPVVIRYRLVETWAIWASIRQNINVAEQVCAATAWFLGFDTESPNYCDGVPQLMSAYTTDGGVLKGDTDMP